MSNNGMILWFTGLSGSGKSTLAQIIQEEMTDRGVNVECLDGDEVRQNLSKGLGFSKEDRDTNIRRIGYVANLLARNGAVSITAAISPYKAVRDEIRDAADAEFVPVSCGPSSKKVSGSNHCTDANDANSSDLACWLIESTRETTATTQYRPTFLTTEFLPRLLQQKKLLGISLTCRGL